MTKIQIFAITNNGEIRFDPETGGILWFSNKPSAIARLEEIKELLKEPEQESNRDLFDYSIIEEIPEIELPNGLALGYCNHS